MMQRRSPERNLTYGPFLRTELLSFTLKETDDSTYEALIVDLIKSRFPLRHESHHD